MPNRAGTTRRTRTSTGPLAKRGEDAAPRMGAFMAAQRLAPDLILCSPAVRARQTLDLVLPHLAGGARRSTTRTAFYLAAPSVLLARVRKIEAKVRPRHDRRPRPRHARAGHWSSPARAMPSGCEALAAKFPTAGLAVIRFKAREWAKIRRGRQGTPASCS